MRTLIMILLLLPFLAMAETPGETPRGGFLEVRPSIVDFGLISNDSIVEQQFTLVNTGDEPVVVKRVFSDCSCTRPATPKRPIQPDDSVTLKVKYDPRGYSAGEFRRLLRVRSNARNPSVTVVLSGVIEKKWKH
ncbi:MAG: DUF1573 domain-containing protein [Clostridium sp.]|nr:DUF1573 domain-containing protein [Clostridium sp.]